MNPLGLGGVTTFHCVSYQNKIIDAFMQYFINAMNNTSEKGDEEIASLYRDAAVQK